MNSVLLAIGLLEGWEILLVLAVVFVLLGAKHLPEIARGLGTGMRGIRDASDQVGHEVGESLAGIQGRPAAEALTHDNQAAEFCDPAILRDTADGKPARGSRGRRLRRRLRRTWHEVRRLLTTLIARR